MCGCAIAVFISGYSSTEQLAADHGGLTGMDGARSETETQGAKRDVRATASGARLSLHQQSRYTVQLCTESKGGILHINGPSLRSSQKTPTSVRALVQREFIYM